MTTISNIRVSRFFFFLLFSSLIFTNCSDNENPSKVRSLEVEHLTNPVGLDKTIPRFSWIYDDEERGAAQSAYRILVSADKENLENEDGVLWDSGKVNGSNTINIRYEGDELKSSQKYYWKLRVWDENGAAAEWAF